LGQGKGSNWGWFVEGERCFGAALGVPEVFPL
ncbi:MAG: hypothetical protein JWP44_4979, partial [Mucilaginibacter sp.]|nr:hypothetical protein [Mucilaginibacter sp.]